MQAVIDLTSINEKIYDVIKERIVTLTYAPGDKIDLSQLREELGVSQTPIKDALRKLAGEGLVEINSRRGTFVKNVSERDIAEIFDTRIILESAAAEMVAPNITANQCDELEGLLNKQPFDSLKEKRSLSKREIKDLIQSDCEFHLSIIRFTNNKMLWSIYNQLNDYMQIVRFRYLTRDNKTVARVIRGHPKVLEAFRERAPKKAKAAIIKHINEGKKAFLGNS